jgi:hypothetical protein
MNEVEDYIEEFEGEQRNILLHFHLLFVADLGLTAKLNYGIPFYYLHSWICYLNPNKKGGIELAFIRGNELSNAQGLLEAKNRKQVVGITFTKLKEIHEESILEIVHEAILIDENAAKAASKNKKKRNG